MFISRDKKYRSFRWERWRWSGREKMGTILRKLAEQKKAGGAAIKRQRQSFPRPTLFTLLAGSSAKYHGRPNVLGRILQNHKHWAIRILQQGANHFLSQKINRVGSIFKTRFPPACSSIPCRIDSLFSSSISTLVTDWLTYWLFLIYNHLDQTRPKLPDQPTRHTSLTHLTNLPIHMNVPPTWPTHKSDSPVTHPPI